MTIGNDAGTAQTIMLPGAVHGSCPAEDFRVDEEHDLVTTPARLLAGRTPQAEEGIEALLAEVLELCH